MAAVRVVQGLQLEATGQGCWGSYEKSDRESNGSGWGGAGASTGGYRSRVLGQLQEERQGTQWQRSGLWRGCNRSRLLGQLQKERQGTQWQR